MQFLFCLIECTTKTNGAGKYAACFWFDEKISPGYNHVKQSCTEAILLKTDTFRLEELLEDIKRGEVQLPDFQRSWIWKDKQIKSLLESVIRNFPISSILLLECDADKTIFSCRTIEGVGEVTNKPRYLVLDGQQRLTSLFGALFSDKPVKCGDKEFFYYVDMKKAIIAVENCNNDDSEDMIMSVNEEKKFKTLDLSTSEKEYAAGMFPLNKVFDSRDWLSDYEDFHGDNSAKKLAYDFDKKIIKQFSRYKIAYIELEKNTSLEAVCRIFEKANIGVVKLDVFDLLTAIFAAHVDETGNPINLRTDWKKISDSFKNRNLKILESLKSTDFVTALTLLATYENNSPVGCKRENVLNLQREEYLKYKAHIIDGFAEAAQFLAGESITEEKYLPYKPQLIPLATILSVLKLRGKNNAASLEKVRKWYWCGVFGEAYRDGHLARFVKDITQVMKWIDSDETPDIIKNTQISAPKLMKYKDIKSAAYKGMISIIFRNGATDFLSGKKMNVSANFSESIDDHHIFPKKYCEDNEIPKEKYDSIANKTPILSGTNQKIGKKSPSVYIRDFEKSGIKSQLINNSLRSHFADPELCRMNNFDAFIIDRAQKILDEIQKLTGRDISDREKIFVELA